MKIKIFEKITFWIFKLFEKYIRKNPYGEIAGWWQSFMYDKKAFEFVKRKYPQYSNLLTKSIKISFEEKLYNTSDLVWGISDILESTSHKGNIKIEFVVSLWQEKKLISFAECLFIQEKGELNE